MFNDNNELTVEKVENGYVLSWYENSDKEDDLNQHKQVIEDYEGTDGKKDSAVALLYAIAEHFELLDADEKELNIEFTK